MMGWWHDGWGMGWGGGILMIFFWVAVMAGIVWLARFLIQGREGRAADPLKILKERLARGDIGIQEYEDRKKKILED